MNELDRKAVARWRDLYPLDARMPDEQLFATYGGTYSFARIRLDVAVEPLRKALWEVICNLLPPPFRRTLR